MNGTAVQFVLPNSLCCKSCGTSCGALSYSTAAVTYFWTLSSSGSRQQSKSSGLFIAPPDHSRSAQLCAAPATLERSHNSWRCVPRVRTALLVLAPDKKYKIPPLSLRVLSLCERLCRTACQHKSSRPHSLLLVGAARPSHHRPSGR